ncbi:MAG: TetR/AcrR family transcriptional regulator C-terminal domain-containing protein [Galactobacillus timonensis]|uniref:TetR/AcrR family transcriptional regulator C-terminal domain-containing protein n=1 Tax=Galactobacillus timonensis TaxID=2041840 RepID=UPI002409FE78|nr:TetR/AcrR family transcriptional regulator C-terminal domain-containing protein [Galactobacillus timonensis]MDD5851784.1 TetR/AcrR family transcriptional regulator C-terminal domain-containing protein [Galactobacillus timonensis]MDD6600518.1 TetR/AcrR family transcriptional regulator C-terminal domain-containing protein [Galactobacillus timonensis]
MFFTNAFRTDTQNNLKQHDFERITAFYDNLIREKTHHDPDPEIQNLLEMYCQASVYKTGQWILSGMETAPNDLANLMIDAMPPKLYALFERLHVID